jgi:hypothetical protein
VRVLTPPDRKPSPLQIVPDMGAQCCPVLDRESREVRIHHLWTHALTAFDNLYRFHCNFGTPPQEFPKI